MTNKDKSYYKQKLLTLRNVIDVIIEELAEGETEPAPRKRRNLKAEDIDQFATEFFSGKWKQRKRA